MWAEEAGEEEEEEQQREDKGEMETTSKGKGEAGTVMRDKGGRGPANIAGTQCMCGPAIEGEVGWEEEEQEDGGREVAWLPRGPE